MNKRLIIFMVIILFFNSLSFSQDSTGMKKAKLYAKTQALGTDEKDFHDTKEFKPPSPRAGSLACPSGYTLTAANIGRSYYWDPNGRKTLQTYCDVDCNNFFLGCGCNYQGKCPSGCFLGCTNDCKRDKVFYQGEWVYTSNQYSVTSYRCNKIVSGWVNTKS